MPWGAAIGAVGAIGGALIGSSGSKSAANAQKEATQAAIDEDKRQYDLTRADLAPYRQAGTNALTQLTGEMNAPVTAADVMQDPGYQFGLTQGQTALDRKIAASGGRVSGSALKAASRFGTDYASTGYGAAYQRRQDRLNRLAAIAGIGQTATNSSAAAGAQSSANIGNLLSSQGNASAANNLAQGSIWGNATNQLAALAQNYMKNRTTTSPASAYDYQNGSDIGQSFSDIRLKTNVVAIGKSPRGHAWYRWDWIDGSGSSEGVIAQEVSHVPGAVSIDPASGFLMVDYSKV